MSDFTGAAAAAAVVAFVATNVDDLVVLLIFFARVMAQRGPASEGGAQEGGAVRSKGPVLKHRQVVCGQLLGFSVLVAISLIGLGIGFVVPSEYIGLIGFLPLLLGLWGVLQLIKAACEKRKKAKNASKSPFTAAALALPTDAAGSRGIAVSDKPQQDIEAAPASVADADAGSAKKEDATEAPAPEAAEAEAAEAADADPASSSDDDDDDDDDDEDPNDNWLVKLLRRVFCCCSPRSDGGDPGAQARCASLQKFLPSAFTLEMATTTIANGADNISIYIPLFAAIPPLWVAATLAIFYSFLLLWCLAAFLLVSLKPVAKLLSRYGEKMVPFLLIALGLYILHGSVAFPVDEKV
jgi:cadmium resistance protein CadD (predicted permease)